MKNFSIWLMITTFTISIVFHLLVLIGIIPFQIVWGGRLKTQEEMMVFESISLFLNGLFLFIMLNKLKVFKMKLSEKLLNFIFIVISVLFFLNTVGNIISENNMEKVIFTPITFMLFLASAYLVFDYYKYPLKQ